MAIDIDDPMNPAGYLDVARLLAGPYWSPRYNADWSPVQNVVDSSKSTRTDAGDKRTNVGTQYETLPLRLSWLIAEDRAKLLQIVLSEGSSKNIFFSLYPQNDDPVLEQDNMIYGQRSGNGVRHAFFNSFSTDITMEIW